MLTRTTAEAPQEIQVDRAAARSELAKILHLPASDLPRRLGPFRFEEQSTLKVTAGTETLEEMEETVSLEADARGRWHGLHDNSKDQGVEAWWLGDRLAVRMRYGKIVARRPEGNEPTRMLEEMMGSAAAYYDLVERYVERKDAGRMQLDGRPVRVVDLALRGSPEAPLGVLAGWRGQAVATELKGKVVVDEQTGVAIGVVLSARSRYKEEGNDREMQIEVKRKLRPTVIAAIQIPREAIESPIRQRYETTRRELLGGLAPDKQMSNQPPANVR